MGQGHIVSDADVVRQVRSGRREAFGILVRRYFPALQALAFSRTKSYADAEEIAQEACLKAFRYLDRLDEPSRFGGWIVAIVKNTARSFLRERQRRAEVSTEGHAAELSVTPDVESRDLHAFLREQIGELDEQHRDVLLLHYFTGMSASEIGAVLDISQSAAQKRLQRARNVLGNNILDRLRTELRPKGSPEERASHIMGVVARMPVAWKAVPTAATTAAAAGGIGKVVSGGLVAKAVTVSLVAALALVLASAGVWAFKRQGPAEEKVAYGVNIEAEETQENELAEPTENFSASKAAVVSAIVEPVEETPVTEAASSGPEAGLEPRDVAPAGYPGTKVARGETDVIRGTVYGPAGKPLAGAKVWATRWAVGPLDTREDVTGADGRFRLRVPAGQWRVAARKGYLGGDIAPGFEGQLITVGMGLTFNKDIRMEKRGIVRGRILNKETGKPIPSGRILFDGALTTADADGRYLIEGVRQNTVTQRLYPRCPGYSYRGFGFSTLLCGETELDLRLARAGGRATGTVTDEAGRPLAHASVRAGRRWVVCDENGRFEADGIPFDVRSYYEAQLPCYVNICAQNLGETPYQWCLLDANSENLLEVGFVIGGEVPKEVRRIYPAPSRRPAGVIRGRVVDSSGRPVRDFQVRTTVSSTKALLPKDQIQWGGTSTYFTSEDGTFVIGGYNHHLRAGKITRVVVTADGYSQAALDTVTIEAFGAQTPGKEVLLRLSAARTLHVRVTEDAAPGKAVQGACVRVLDPNSIRFGQAFEWQDVKYSSERGAETDARGLACFNGLSLSRGTVAVQKDGYAAARVEWRSGESELRVALQPECRIEGLVLDGTGKPRDGYSVFLRYSRDGVFSMFDTGCGTFQVRVKKNQTWFRPEDAGRFRFDQLPAGVYTLYVSWLDYGNGIDEPLRQRKSYNDEFTLAPGQVLKVAYPEDAIADNPERWLAESVQDLDDGRLRQRLLGTWVRESVLPKSGRREWAVYYFGEDGSSQRTAFVEGLSDAIRLSGWFKVEQGCVKIQGDDGKCMTYTSAAFPSDDTLVLGTGHSAQPTLHRAASLDEALRKGESLLSAVTPVPRDQGLPKTSGDSHTRRGYFGR